MCHLLANLCITLNFCFFSLTDIPDETSFNGEFNWNNDTFELTYVLSHNENITDRGLGLTSFSISHPRDNERRSNLDIFRCLYLDCLPPPPPTYPTGRPEVIYYWSQAETWTELDRPKPVAGDDFDLPGLYYIGKLDFYLVQNFTTR